MIGSEDDSQDDLVPLELKAKAVAHSYTVHCGQLGSQRVVAKVVRKDNLDVLDDEVRWYRKVEYLWGKGVAEPSGLYQGDDLALLLLKHQGEPLQTWCGQHANAYRLLTELHRCNMVHHAIELDHFLLDDRGSLTIIDFKEATPHIFGRCNSICTENFNAERCSHPHPLNEGKNMVDFRWR
ncbi:hypothetical protein DACRYDRAFT_25325 [Dacryopinax primogenitus]|uniref:Protein kinase domain-containing protein n=1 Tax=Dacryopinax primogenitus (strain DJM 731) TaxID=1858805 RepID=M5FVA4_DACPD|nr:uncharacterized protein DACRYDRAFT_25325 [Dacryopinax primogenitus]EJT97246.1 hypothetical protein DACRYDRAFT_25325 [Dacryopinax primogenitus]